MEVLSVETVAAVMVAAGFGSALTAIVQRWLTRETDKAKVELLELEADAMTVDTANQVVALVRSQLTELSVEAQAARMEAAGLRREVAHLAAVVEALTEEVHRLGGDPAKVRVRRLEGGGAL